MTQLSPHFDTSEFRCKCGCGYGANVEDIHPELIRRLEILREACGGVPLEVTSGCRCQAHDTLLDSDPGGEAIGKLKRGRPSYHVLGGAADIWGPERELLRVKALLVFCEGGVGLPNNGNWVHVDIGPQRRWTYPKEQIT